MERIQTEWAWKPVGMKSTKPEDIEPGDKLGEGMINEAEKPSCDKSNEFIFVMQVQKKDKGVEAIFMKS